MSENKIAKPKLSTIKKLTLLLRSNPNILAEHPELFEIITLNEERVDNVTSLAHRQVDILKARIEDHNKAMIRFVNNAKHNDFITSKLFDITYELTACRELGDIFDVLYQDLISAFAVDAVGIKLTLDIPSQKELSEVDHTLVQNPTYQEIVSQIKKGSSVCGTQFSESLLSLFFGPHAETTESSAFTPLIMPNSSECIGILGMSSSKPEKFSDKTKYGTLHLDRLGRIAAIAIERATRDSVRVLA